jgi:diguanylate cyclase
MRCARSVAHRHRLPQFTERNVVPLPSQPHLAVPNRASAAQPAGASRARELAFVHRVYHLRVVGLGLGMLCVAPVLWLQGSGWWWLLLACNGLVWPHVACRLAERSHAPRRAEERNLMVDSALGGMWMAVIQFNLLPSVLLLTMLSMDKISAGGPRLLLRSLACLVATCVAASALLGFPVALATPMPVVLGCLPLLVAYPLMIGFTNHALASRISNQNRRLDEVGRTDDLTGLANRRHGLAVAEAELTRARETGRPVSLILLDLDHFKRINDMFGHLAGDEVLRGVAQALRASSRGGSDTPVRYGGDEFILILPDTSLDGADETAARIRTHIEALVFERVRELRCAVSLGAVQASPRAEDVEGWIQRADLALYAAKAAGRGKFVARGATAVA